jgi:outer membrane autotransporter protein
MDSALQIASVNTVALDKILTNDVRKRLGDIRSDSNTTGVWMRWDGGRLKGDAGVTNDFNTVQIGGDTKVGKNCRVGVAGSFTHGDSEFARGIAELEGFSFATYATWMGENGMFADVVARLGHFSNEMKVEGRTGDIDSRVASLSGEYGWRFDLCEQFFIEPQVELAYTYVSSDDLQLGTAQYSLDSVNSLTGRAGVVFGWKLPDERGNLYARASVVQQFLGDAKISGTNGEAFNVQELDGNDTWLEYGIGANVKLTDKTYLWADIERTEGSSIEEEWRGTVGVRFSF